MVFSRRAGRAEFDDRARALAGRPEIPAPSTAKARPGPATLIVRCRAPSVRDKTRTRLCRKVARMQERARGCETGDDIAAADGIPPLTLMTRSRLPVTRSQRTTDPVPAGVPNCNAREDRMALPRDGPALELAVDSDGADALAVLVYLRRRLLFSCPQRMPSRMSRPSGATHQRARGVPHVSGQRSVCRQPVGGVCALTGRRNHRDRPQRQYSTDSFLHHG